jgi:hypothetical protein
MKESVTAYIEKQQTTQREICHKLRNILLATFPEIKEEMKLGVPWYEGKYYIVALKDHVNLGLSIEGLSKDKIALLKGSGKTMKTLEIRSMTEIDEEKIADWLKAVK